MVFGTFDGLHEGHLDFFAQAKKSVKNPILIISVARDENVKKIKGVKPELSEKKRKSLIEKTGIADLVVLSGKKEYLPHIFKINPDIIALGYDQKAYVSELKKDLEKFGSTIKVIRLKPYKANIFKNHLLKHKRKLKTE